MALFSFQIFLQIPWHPFVFCYSSGESSSKDINAKVSKCYCVKFFKHDVWDKNETCLMKLPNSWYHEELGSFGPPATEELRCLGKDSLEFLRARTGFSELVRQGSKPPLSALIHGAPLSKMLCWESATHRWGRNSEVGQAELKCCITRTLSFRDKHTHFLL